VPRVKGDGVHERGHIKTSSSIGLTIVNYLDYMVADLRGKEDVIIGSKFGHDKKYLANWPFLFGKKELTIDD